MQAEPLHRCSRCRLAVIVIDGNVIRACRCEAPVVGSMTATVRGVGGLLRSSDAQHATSEG